MQCSDGGETLAWSANSVAAVMVSAIDVPLARQTAEGETACVADLACASSNRPDS